MAPRSFTAFALLIVACFYISHVLAQGRWVVGSAGWEAYHGITAGSGKTSTVSLPTGLSWLGDAYEAELIAPVVGPPTKAGYLLYKLKNTFTSWSGGKYQSLVVYLQTDQTDLRISFSNDIMNYDTPFKPVSDFIQTGTLNNWGGTWVRAVFPLGNVKDRQLYNRFILKNYGNTPMKIRFAGWVGNEDGTVRGTVNPAADEAVPTSLAGRKYEFTTAGQSYQLPDPGLVIQWLCEDGDALRSYPDLVDVRIQAFRDTDIGVPLPMIRYNYTADTSAKLENGIWKISRIWGGPNYYDAYHYPYPELACAPHNADFIEIGDFKTASYILVAWVPQWRIEETHAIGAYAQYVKETRKNGKDTIAVHLRSRVSTSIGDIGTPWVSEARPNCTAEIVADPVNRWQCPDHIWFKNTQMGELHLGKDRLMSLTSFNQKWFKETGVDFTADVIPVVQSLISYSGDVYAAPVGVNAYPWMLNITTMNAMRTTKGHPEMKLPPPLEDWGSAWWKAWNMDVFKEYLGKLSAAGYFELLPLPSLIGGETEMFTYFGYYYGATLFNSTGRCGLLDGKAEKALTETLLYWQKTPGVLQPRVTYPEHQERFDKWLLEPKKNPLEEPLFYMGDTHTWSFGDPTKKEQDGFSFENGFGGDLVKIYPPTGVGQVSAMLVGLHKENPYRDATKGYQALLGAIAFNERLHVNDPFVKDAGPQGGVSGYRSAKYTAEYLGQGKTRTFYADMMDQVMFMGYPVPQYASYGLLEKYNPMQILFNEVMFKGIPLKEALERACVIINHATRPPCDESNWKARIQPNFQNNKGDVVYEWNADKDAVCRSDLAAAKAIPATVVNAVPLPTISTQSGMSKAMTAFASIAIIVETFLIVMFLWKRNSQVIRASSIIASLLILFGAIMTLVSVIMRTTGGDSIGWVQCYGTYWFFAIGFGTVLGALAMKSYRVDKIFRSRKQGTAFGDLMLMTLIGLIVFGEIVMMLIYQFWTIPGSDKRMIDVKLSNVAVEVEDCKKSHEAATYLLYIVSTLFVVQCQFVL
ncbi:hypothetical protein HK097_003677 [Rhizophlyctis rosea]|uniref:G-protein coupled receptors family 3 profile domain-containing protein n=1 Tax=Rhizophlyctis rosea TaxID=64517 RepID=A0AAD5SGB2_9FUNG|nr:hypothetical protein HK097_003677 [Rhizophlyctis rosea]